VNSEHKNYVRLAAAVLAQAASEALAGDPGAIAWLRDSHDAILYRDILGLDPGRYRTFIANCQPGEPLTQDKVHQVRQSARRAAMAA